MKLVFEQILVGGDRNFGYLFGDREAGVAAIIDPSYQPELLIERAKSQNLKVQWIINTHSHNDHTNGNEKAKQLTGAEIAAHKSSPVSHDLSLEDGEQLKIGDFHLKVFHTPGHCEDHIVLFNPEHHIALTGDHLFVGKIGGTGNEETSKQQWGALNRLFEELPEETTIWPGHNYGCRPSSTLALERACNPFLRSEDFPEFLKMKQTWSTYKAEMGLL